jgi:hypothetical protein
MVKPPFRTEIAALAAQAQTMLRLSYHKQI